MRIAATRPLAPTLAAAMLLLGLAISPVAGKVSLQAILDAPIAFDSPPGAVLLVGATIMAPDDATGGMVPVIGTPVYLELTGPDGDTTRAAAEGTRTAGYYLFHIEVPPGGPRQLEMGVSGSNQDGPMDLPMTMAADPFTFGPIREGTAQLATPAVVAPVVSAAPVAPAVASAAPAAASAAPAAASAAPAVAEGPALAPADDGLPAWAPLVGVGAILVLVAGAALAAGRSRGGRPGETRAARGG